MKRTTSCLAVVAGVLGALAPATAAAATDELVRSRDHLGAPALAGSGVVTSVAPLGGRPRVVHADAAGRTTTLATGSQRTVFSYAASASRVAVVASRSRGEGVERYELLAGPPAGPLASVERCTDPRVLAPPPAPAVDGDAVAFSGGACTDEAIVVLDGATRSSVPAGGRVVRLALAGRYLAWLEVPAGGRDARLVVHDRSAGAVAYTAPAGIALPPGDLDLRADGTAVVAAFRSSDPGVCGALARPRVSWHSVADPGAHDLGETECRPRVRLDGERVALVRPVAGTRQVELALSDLSGAAVRPVARHDRRWAPGAFDWDGARVAWGEERCRDFAVLARAGTDASAPEPATSCPVRVSNLRLRADGAARVRIACPSGCSSRTGQGLQLVSPRWLHVVRSDGRSTTYAPPVPFDVRPGASATLRIPLTARQRAIARRNGRTSVRVKLTGQHLYAGRLARTLIAR